MADLSRRQSGLLALERLPSHDSMTWESSLIPIDLKDEATPCQEKRGFDHVMS